MKFISINNVVINMEYIDYVEKANNGLSITVHMNSGTQFLFDIKDAYWLNKFISDRLIG